MNAGIDEENRSRGVLLVFLNRKRVRNTLAVGLVSLLSGAVLSGTAFAGDQSKVGDKQSHATKSASKQTKGALQRPAGFTENVGQWDARGDFLLKGPGVNYWVTPTGFILDYKNQAPASAKAKYAGQAVHVSFVGGNKVKPFGVKPQPAVERYMAADGKGGKTTKAYAEVMSRGIYDGVDLRSYTESRTPRYDLIVRAKANPSKIGMSFAGASGVVAKGRDLIVKTEFGEKKHVGLTVFQVVNGKRVVVPASFTVAKNNVVGFKLGAYDRNRDLVIDPLIYGSYYGGDTGFDEVFATTTDVQGTAYMTGRTRSANFPVIAGPYGFNLAGGWDAFVSIFEGDAYIHRYSAFFGGGADEQGNFIRRDQYGDIWVAGQTRSTNFPGFFKNDVYYIQSPYDPVNNATKGTYRIRHGGRTTAELSFSSTAAEVQAALEPVYGVGRVTVSSNTAGADGTLSKGAEYRVETPVRSGGQAQIVNSSVAITFQGRDFLFPYSILKNSDIFVIRFKRTANGLNPLPTKSLIFGGDGQEALAGFDVAPSADGTASGNVRLAFGGQTTDIIPNIFGGFPAGTGGFAEKTFVARYDFLATQQNYARVTKSTFYLPDQVESEIGGLVMDKDGFVYIAGTVFGSGTTETATNPTWVTTPANFVGARLLRRADMYVRKYAPEAKISYSVLLGGNLDERIGSIDTTTRFEPVNAGSSIAIDPLGNAYVTGITTSFNYPRTRGVYGEVFNASPNLVVTKLSSDGKDLVYSTNMRVGSGGFDKLVPAGIAVDIGGNAVVTGNLKPTANFPDTHGSTPGDPNEPTENLYPSIPLSADALDPEYTSPDAPDLPTTEGFMLVLNAQGSDLVYGSYIGGLLDDFVFGPYVDSLGDLWTVGWTDSSRSYVLRSSTGTPTFRGDVASLPAGLINRLAFKANGDQGAASGITVKFGAYDEFWPFQVPAQNPLGGDATVISTQNTRDGFILRKRVAFPFITTLDLVPNSIPGGLGATSVATVTLNTPAGPGGAQVLIELSNPVAASFSQTADVFTRTFTIPQGATTGTITIFSKAVLKDETTDVTATYLGKFSTSTLTVKPWLTGLLLDPTEVVGGQDATGTVTLSFPAPVGGVTIPLTSTDSTLITYPGGGTVTVPAGQLTANFIIRTRGVTSTRTPSITAGLLGVNVSQPLIVLPIKLDSVTFNPARVAGGTSSTGTVTFAGVSPVATKIRLTFNAGTPGYKLREVGSTTAAYPLVLNVPPNTGTINFNLDTVYEPINTSRTVTAQVLNADNTPAGGTVSGTLLVDNIDVTGVSLTPNSGRTGDTVTGRVTISAAAPAGGVVVRLTSSSSKATVPASVSIAAGATEATFALTPISTIGLDVVATISAIRRTGFPETATFTVLGSDFSVSVAPTSIRGGLSATGTVSLEFPAAVATRIKLKSSSSSVTVPAEVTVPVGASSVNFAVVTRGVFSSTNATITASFLAAARTADITVLPVSLRTFTISPQQLKAGQTATGTVTLDAPAPTGGLVVTLNFNRDLFTTFPAGQTITIAAGQTSGKFTLVPKQLSVPVNATITATAGEVTKSVVLSILR